MVITEKYRSLLAASLILALVLLYFHKILDDTKILIHEDVALYFYPLKVASAEALKRLTLPLWTPELQSGFPLLADSQAATFYPLETVPHILLSHVLAHNLAIVLQAFLASFFTYLFVRRIGASHIASLCSAVIFVFAGPIIPAAGTPRLATVLWWPLLFLLAENILRAETTRRRIFYGSATAVIVGIQLLAGFIQLALFGLLAVSLYLLFFAITRYPRQPGDSLRLLVTWAMTIMAGFALAAIQLVPTFELTQSSVRAAGAESQLATSGSLFPPGIAALFAPGWAFLGALGSETQNMYIGLLALMIATTTLFGAKNRYILFFWLLFVLSLLLAFGSFTPLYGLLSGLPGFSYFRIPSRFIYLSVFALAVLVAVGVDRLFAQEKNMLPLSRTGAFAIRGLAAMIGLVVIANLTGWAALNLGGGPLRSLAEQYVRTRVYGSAYHIQGWGYYENKINGLFATAENAVNLSSASVYVPILFGLAGLLCLVFWKRGLLNRTTIKTSVLSLTIIDLLFLQSFFAKPTDATILSDPKTAAMIRDDGSLFRTYGLVTQDNIIANGITYERLPANYSLLSGIPNVGIYSALGVKRHYDLLGALGAVNLGFGLRPSSASEVRQNLNLLSLFNVKYIFSDAEIDDARLNQLEASQTKVYENKSVLPRAFVVPSFRVVTDENVTRSMLLEESFDPRSYVILEEEPHLAFGAPSASPASEASIVSYSSRRVQVEARLDGWGFLLLTDTYYPGWHAYVDGQEANIYRADYLFRAILLPPGRHQIEFIYDPLSLKIGAGVSLIALFALSIIILAPLTIKTVRS